MGRNAGQSGNIRIRVDRDGQRRQWVGHDDRGEATSSHNRVWTKSTNKKVSFNDHRGGRGGGGIHKRLGRGSSRGSGLIKPSVLRGVALHEDDDDMRSGEASGYQAGRARPHIRGVFSKRGKRGYGRALMNKGSFVPRTGPPRGWFKIQVNHGAKYDKEVILRTMLSKVSDVAPIAYQKQGPHHVFYVDNRETANLLRTLDNEGATTLPDGFKLTLKVDSSPPPLPHIGSEVIEKVKLVMSSRYNVNNKALDLKKFYADRQFLGEAAYAPLGRTNVLKEIVKIIGENIPGIEAVDFSDNKIRTLEHFETLVEKAPHVKFLYLAENSIIEPKELLKCQSWKLVELKLAGNPLITKFKDNNAYETWIRKVFPTLKVLDGQELPPMVTFDDDEVSETTLMQPVLKMSCNPEAETIVLKFLEQYIACFDSNNRAALSDAYHDTAVMSLTTAYPRDVSVHGTNKLNEYLSESRNLMRVTDPHRRFKLLRKGKLAIVSLLDALPKTQHDTSSFTLDIPFATEKLMTFTVTGVYKEKAITDTPLRHFNRMFVVVPHGQGFCIINETLFVTIPTQSQAKKTLNNEPHISPLPPVPAPNVADIQQKILQLSQRTGMNEHWTKQCLEPNEWNVEKAYNAFEEAKRQGKIPPEAFTK